MLLKLTKVQYTITEQRELIACMLIPFCLNSLVLPNCGHPGSSENAVLVHSTYWAGEYVRYLCNPGYTMLGHAVRRCLPSGQWSGNAVQCKSLIYDETEQDGKNMFT